MKYIDEFRNVDIAEKLIEKIHNLASNLPEIKIMEVCGTHTMSIFRNGIKNILPDNIKLISGPGCPVCVTPNDYLDKLIELSQNKDVIITTFGDMIKVPGSYSSLETEKSEGADIRIVYSAWDSLKICTENPDKIIVFAAVGFETTIPGTALTIKGAEKSGIRNFFILSAQKLIPPAMRALSTSADIRIDGFLCPAHVSAIIGSKAYDFLADEYSKACVVTGFEPLDVLQGIIMILKQIQDKNFYVDIQYSRVVKRDLSDLKIAIHYGCHYLQPSDIHEHFDDVDDPKSIERLVSVTGAQVVNYPGEGRCCGGSVLAVDEKSALAIAKVVDVS